MRERVFDGLALLITCLVALVVAFGVTRSPSDSYRRPRDPRGIPLMHTVPRDGD